MLVCEYMRPLNICVECLYVPKHKMYRARKGKHVYTNASKY